MCDLCKIVCVCVYVNECAAVVARAAAAHSSVAREIKGKQRESTEV